MVQGYCYAIFGFIGMLLNLVVAIAIKKDKSMQNLTYKFMIQLALSDIESLWGTTTMPGLLIANEIRSADNYLIRLAAYFASAGFHLSSFWMVSASFSRWAIITRRHRINQWLTSRRQITICLCLWIGLHSFYTPTIFCSDIIVPMGESGTFSYLNNSLSQTIRRFGEGHNYFSVLLQLLFNSMSFSALIKMRKEILSPELRRQNKREVKLYVQCAIDSFIFTLFIALLYSSFYASYVDQWITVVLEILVFLNHVDCALLYVCFNRKLRSGIAQFFKKAKRPCGFGSSVAPMAPLPER